MFTQEPPVCPLSINEKLGPVHTFTEQIAAIRLDFRLYNPTPKRDVKLQVTHVQWTWYSYGRLASASTYQAESIEIDIIRRKKTGRPISSIHCTASASVPSETLPNLMDVIAFSERPRVINIAKIVEVANETEFPEEQQNCRTEKSS